MSNGRWRGLSSTLERGLVLMLLGAATLAHGAQPTPESALDPNAWQAAVDAWRAGAEAPLGAWARAQPAALQRLRAQVSALAAEGPAERLRAGVRLHVLAAHAAELEGASETWQAHHDLVDKLLERGPRASDALPAPAWQALWRVTRLARGYDLLSRWRPSRAKQAFDDVLERWPEDAEALLALGFTEALRATVPALERERYVIWDAGEGAWRAQAQDLRQRQADKRASLSASRKLLQRALAAGAAASTVHLHLGRLALSEGRRDDATSSWRTALLTARDDDACLAHIFLARVDELREDAPAALAHYLAAVAAAPHSRAARLGLSAALGRAGQRGESLRQLHEILSLGSDARDAREDPWLRSQFQPGDAPRALFEALGAQPR